MRRSVARLLLFLVLLVPTSLFAADDAETSSAPPGRPKIGLALSGGGSRGCAHVGVLKVLEAYHIPVDYIAGTSMGAVVGGLYAAGLDASEIEEFFVSSDWTDMMLDEPHRYNKSFRRKEEDRLYLFDFEMGHQELHLKMPRGYRQGRKMTNRLRAMTLPVAGVRSFDK